MKYIIVFFLCFASIVHASKTISLADLNHLVKLGQWTEALEKIDHVNVSERGDKWLKLSRKILNENLNRFILAQKNTKILTTLEKHLDVLDYSENGNIIKRSFESVFLECGSNIYCLRKLKETILLSKFAELSFHYAKSFTLKVGERESIGLFEHAFKFGHGKCIDVELERSIKYVTERRIQDNALASAKKILFYYCSKEYKKKIKKIVLSNKISQKNLCLEAIQKQVLRGISKRKCEKYLKGSH